MKKKLFFSWLGYLLLLFFLILSLIITDAYWLFLLCCAFISLPILSFFLLCLQTRSLHVTLHKEKENIRIRIHSNIHLGHGLLHVCIKEFNRFTGETHTRSLNISCDTTFTLDKETIGMIEVSLQKTIAYDALHLFQRQILNASSVHYLQVPTLTTINSKLTTIASGYRKEGEWIDKHEIKEYQPGDALKWIHHKLSFKYDQLMVRVFENESYAYAYLFLDLSVPIAQCRCTLSSYQGLIHALINQKTYAWVYYYSERRLHRYEIKVESDLQSSLSVILSSPKSTIAPTTLSVHEIENGLFLLDEKGGIPHAEFR